MLWLYNVLLTLLWPLLIFYRPFFGTLRLRLGKFPPGGYDAYGPGPRILVNAVSAGEVVAVAPVIRELKRRRPGAQIALLTTTQSGQTMAREKLGGELALLAYFPLVDLPFVVRRYLDRLRPQLYITTEAELWPNIQSQALQRGIPVALVNARLYLHNKHGWRGSIVRRLYGLLDLIVCQDERQRDNFLKFGIPAECLSVSGNTKFDFSLPDWSDQQLAEYRTRLLLRDEPLIVAGSTHQGEEELLLDALKAIRRRLPKARLVIAPRRVERSGEVAALCPADGFTARLLSEPPRDWDVLVVDSYGVLVDMYRLADAVVMGGTYHRKVGGHNLLEATLLGKPVVVGPETFGITAQLELLRAAGGAVEARAAELPAVLLHLLLDHARAKAIGEAARQATLANRGAAARAADAVLALLG